MITKLKRWWNATQENKRLREQVDHLRERLAKNQDVINKTNAYWKGILRKQNSGAK